ncbi:hypothetical protein BN1708_004230, partial [Verticillium longisporum]
MGPEPEPSAERARDDPPVEAVRRIDAAILQMLFLMARAIGPRPPGLQQSVKAAQGPNQDILGLMEPFFSNVIPRLLRPLETDGRSITPSLIHGDLWHGNVATDADTQEPVIFDAASSHAHNESSGKPDYSTPPPPPPPLPAAAIRTAMAAGSQNGTGGVHALLESLAPGRRHAFLAPPPAIPAASLQVVKDTLDAFAGQISDEQLQRLKEANRNKKRKREAAAVGDVLKIRKVHLDGFETGQVWQQTRRIIQSALRHSEEALKELEERNEIVVEGADGASGLIGSEDDEDLEVDSDGASDELDGGDEDELSSGDEVDDAELDLESAADLLEDDDLEALDDEEDDEELLDDEEEEDEDDGEGDESDGPDDYVEDPNGLNDGFFSIDDFNKQTQWFEDQDARGDPNTDAGDEDEDEIDWAADPLAADGEDKQDGDEEEDDDDDEEDGPTFGNMDLYAPEDESEDENMDDALEEDTEFNANDVFYKDFFAPPARKADKNKPRKSVRFNPKPVADEDVDRAMEDVRRALFDDESDHGDDSDGALSDVSAGDPRSRRSAHERRQAKLAEEIRKLEAASVAKREWALMGEATAVERPQNSLLEQDLDFEHAGKPIPVITEQVTEGIEELIKRRILAQEFDEVIRRRPDAASVAAGTRRGLVELDDTKSSKGLAELYEDEHQKNANPDSYISKSDEKLRKEEAEVERMWKDLNSTLDALSSWNYRPRPSEPVASHPSALAAVLASHPRATTDLQMLDRLSAGLITLPEATYDLILILSDADGSRAESTPLLLNNRALFGQADPPAP